MSETTTEVIKVTGVSQYSAFAGQVRYGFNKPVNSTMFQKGHTYSVGVVIGSKGAKYISNVVADLGSLNADQPALNPSINQAVAKKTDGLSRDEWAAKDKRIGRAGRIQAATVAVASHSRDLEDLKANAVSLANWMEDYVNESFPAAK